MVQYSYCIMTNQISHLNRFDAASRCEGHPSYAVRVDTGPDAVRRTLSSLGEHSVARELRVPADGGPEPNLAVSAWDGPRLAGIALATSDFHGLICITHLVVDLPRRRQGIARELMRSMQNAVAVARVLLLATPVMEPYDPARSRHAAPIPVPMGRRRPRREPAWLHSVDHILASEYSMKLTVGQLAQRVGIHRVHISRTFRRLRHESIIHALARQRIDAACRQLMRGPVVLADLALDVGFSDQAQFSRAFKRITGTTPGVFRALFRVRDRVPQENPAEPVMPRPENCAEREDTPLTLAVSPQAGRGDQEARPGPFSLGEGRRWSRVSGTG
jgi:AraC-like DNA-binding protein